MTEELFEKLREKKRQQIEKAIIWARVKRAWFNVVPPQQDKCKGYLLMLALLMFILYVAWKILA